MLVADRQESCRPVACDPCKLHDQGQLHTVPLVVESHLRGEVQRLQQLKLVLSTHDRFLLLLRP